MKLYNALCVVPIALTLLTPNVAISQEGRIDSSHLAPTKPFGRKVNCHSVQECMDRAVESFEEARKLHGAKDDAPANLYKAHEALLDARAYLQIEHNATPPSALDELPEMLESLRAQRDSRFASLVADHAAVEGDDARAMAALETIKVHFPDWSAPEYKWAEMHIVEIKTREHELKHGLARPRKQADADRPSSCGTTAARAPARAPTLAWCLFGWVWWRRRVS